MKLYKAFGKEKSLKEWAWEYNLNPITLRTRLRSGESLEECLNKKNKTYEKSENSIGKIYNYIKIEKITKAGINCQVLCTCLFNNCNKMFKARLSSIKKGRTKSCGCYSQFLKSSLLANNHPCWRGYGEISLSYFNSIRYNAKPRNIYFDITIEYIWELFLKQNRKCAMTGLELNFYTKRDSHDGTASLDRIDSSKGYIKENIQWIHKDLQDCKFDKENRKFIELCCLVADFSRK